MYIWGQNAMESYGTSLGKHGSPWNIVEGELVSMGYIIGRFQKGYKAREREGKRFGVMVGSGSIYSVPVPPFKTVLSRHYSILSIILGHLQCV